MLRRSLSIDTPIKRFPGTVSGILILKSERRNPTGL
jgi:hypothetical protein